MDRNEITSEILKWLELRLKRANYVERNLTALIKKTTLTEEERKRYLDLIFDSKNIGIKEIITIYQALNEGESCQGFEDFE